MENIDPRYDHVDFSFKVNCPSDLDCAPVCACELPVLPEPEINYLAKDYASFRQLILDRLAVLIPDWRERHAADLGIALVELLAYTGDYLSYYQDAVAHGGLSRYRAPAHFRAAPRPAGGLFPARRLQCPRMGVRGSERRSRAGPGRFSIHHRHQRRAGGSANRFELGRPARGSAAGLRGLRAAGGGPRDEDPAPYRAQRDPLLHVGRKGMLPRAREHFGYAARFVDGGG